MNALTAMKTSPHKDDEVMANISIHLQRIHANLSPRETYLYFCMPCCCIFCMVTKELAKLPHPHTPCMEFWSSDEGKDRSSSSGSSSWIDFSATMVTKTRVQVFSQHHTFSAIDTAQDNLRTRLAGTGRVFKARSCHFLWFNVPPRHHAGLLQKESNHGVQGGSLYSERDSTGIDIIRGVRNR